MEYNPYELLYMSRMSDNIALSALFEQYRNYFLYLRDSMISRKCGYGGMEEEILLEMRLGLIDACQRYREDQDAGWRTFMTVVLKRRAINVLRRADNRDWLNNTIAFDALVEEEESVYSCFAQRDDFANPEFCLQFEEAKAKLEHTIHQMDEEEQSYIYLWTKNTNAHQGSAIMKCSEKRWYKKMEKVRKRVKEEISYQD